MNLPQALLTIIKREIEQYANAQPISFPCQVIASNIDTVNIKTIAPVLGVSDVILTKIPVVKSKYFNIPLTPGDIGICIGTSFLIDSLINQNMPTIIKPIKATKGSGLIFVPLCTPTTDYAKQNDTQLFSMDGQTSITLNAQGITIKDINQNTTELGPTGITITDVNQNKVEMGSSGITITDVNQNKVEMGSSGITMGDAAGNKVEVTSSGVTIKGIIGELKVK